DLVGLRALDRAGNELGAVVAVHNFGAGDIIELRPPDGGDTELLPFDATTVPEADIANGCLVVELPKRDKEMPPPLRGRPPAKRSGGGLLAPPRAPTLPGPPPQGDRERELAMWRASVLTIFPEMFPGPLGSSLAGKALAARSWSLDIVDIRNFATDKHRSVDDTPAGGGPGMVMKPDVLARAIDATVAGARPRLLLSPRGTPLTQGRVEAFCRGPGVILVCGRFEGVDERVIAARDLEEVSIGDYVLSGGEIAAMTLLD